MLAASKPHCERIMLQNTMAYQQTLTFLCTQIRFLSLNAHKKYGLRKLRIFFSMGHNSAVSGRPVYVHTTIVALRKLREISHIRLKQMAKRIDSNDCEFV